MRLIDADVCAEKLMKIADRADALGRKELAYVLYSVVPPVLVDTPTAYDVDEVIEELKSKAFITGEESNDDGCYTDGRFSAVPLDVAIEIVKRGGVIHEYYFTNDTVGDAVKIVKRGGGK